MMKIDRQILHVAFAVVPVENEHRASAFYRDKLGFQVTRQLRIEAGVYWTCLRMPGAQTEILLSPNVQGRTLGYPALYLAVKELEATVDALEANGVKVVERPKDSDRSPGDKYALIYDSEENLVLFYKRGGRT